MSRDYRRDDCYEGARSEDIALTGFQVHCTAALRSMLREHGLSPEFKIVKGREETYLKATFAFNNNQIEVYVYADEAGYFWNSTWNICERPDFDSESDLEDAVVSSLESWISSNAD